MQTKSALLVDDSKVARLTLSKLLQSHGFTLTERGSAEEAMQWLQETDALPDIIFMDVMMGGIDGLTATRQIKENPDWTGIPVIICTGKETEEELKQALASGATAVLAKPPAAEAVEALLADIAPAPAVSKASASTPAEKIPTDSLVAELRAQLQAELEQKLNASLAEIQQQLAQQQQASESQTGLDKLTELSRQLSDSVQQQFGELSQRFSATTEQRISELAQSAMDSALKNFGLNDKLNRVLRDEAAGWLLQQQNQIREQLEQELRHVSQADINSQIQQQLDQRVPEVIAQHWQAKQAENEQQTQDSESLTSQLALQRNIAIGAGLLAVVAIILALI